MRWVRRCILLAQRSWFRVVHYSVMDNHLHLIVEAADGGALSRGMKGLNVRLAKRLNQLFGLKGTLVKERFHSRPLASPQTLPRPSLPPPGGRISCRRASCPCPSEKPPHGPSR